MLGLQILDELIIAGEMQESSKKSVLRTVSQSDAIEEAEQSEDVRSLSASIDVRRPVNQTRMLTLSLRSFFSFVSPCTQSLARIGSRSG